MSMHCAVIINYWLFLVDTIEVKKSNIIVYSKRCSSLPGITPNQKSTELTIGSFQPNSSNPCQVKKFKILEIFTIW